MADVRIGPWNLKDPTATQVDIARRAFARCTFDWTLFGSDVIDVRFRVPDFRFPDGGAAWGFFHGSALVMDINPKIKGSQQQYTLIHETGHWADMAILDSTDRGTQKGLMNPSAAGVGWREGGHASRPNECSAHGFVKAYSDLAPVLSNYYTRNIPAANLPAFRDTYLVATPDGGDGTTDPIDEEGEPPPVPDPDPPPTPEEPAEPVVPEVPPPYVPVPPTPPVIDPGTIPYEPLPDVRVSQAFIDAAEQGGEIVDRILLLDEFFEPVEEITGEDGFVFQGGVSIDRRREGSRRTCSFSITNDGGIWTPRSYQDKLWMMKRFRIEKGFRLADGTIELWSLGVYLIDRPEIQLSSDDTTVSVQAQDRWKYGFGAKFRAPKHFEPGQRVDSAIFELGQTAGYGLDTTLYDLDDGGRVILGIIAWETGASIAAAMQQLAKLYGLDLYMARDGVLTMRPISITGTAPEFALLGDPQYTLEPGENSILLAITKSLSDERLYNATLVEGGSGNRPSFVATARDLNPRSPAYNPVPGTDANWPNGGPIGDRLLPPVRSANVLDYGQAQVLANVLLLENSLIEVDYSLSIGPLPFLEPYDLIQVNEPITGTADSLLIDAVTIPLGEAGEQTVSSKQLRALA